MSKESISTILDRHGFGTKPDQRKYGEQLRNLRNLFLGTGANLSGGDLRSQAAVVRKLASEPSGVLEALIGISHNDDANFQMMIFRASVMNDCLGEKTDVRKITREEVVRRFVEFEGRAGSANAISALEKKALDQYDLAMRLGIDDKYFSQSSLRVSANDIRYRAALRILDPQRRNRLQNALQSELLGLAAVESDSGIRAELQTVWWLRNMVREQGLDHLVWVEHATVSKDLRGGPDIVIGTLGWGEVDIQLKTLRQLGYTDDYQNKIVREAEKKAAGTATRVVRFDSDDFHDLIRAETEENAEQKKRLRKKFLEVLKNLAPEKGKVLFDTLATMPSVDLSQTTQLPAEPKAVRTIIRKAGSTGK